MHQPAAVPALQLVGAHSRGQQAACVALCVVLCVVLVGLIAVGDYVTGYDLGRA